jgi:activating signal cointegrator complex subunit 2
MKIPPIAPWPPSGVRKEIPAVDWQQFLDAWIAITGILLKQSEEGFISSSQDSSLIKFLESYTQSGQVISGSLGELHLSKNCFLLVHRILLDITKPPPELLRWRFLAEFSRTYSSSRRSLHSLLQHLWDSKSSEIEPELSKVKKSLISSLETAREAEYSSILVQLQPLAFASPDIGSFFMVGSDFLDSMTSTYQKASPGQQKQLIITVYLCLVSLLKVQHPHVSLLLDHLYSLKASTESQKLPRRSGNSLLPDLVTVTPLISMLHHHIKGNDAARAETLLTSLESFRLGPTPRPKRRKYPSQDKGKSQAGPNDVVDEYNHRAPDHIHIHRMSLITQVQELFPDLGSGFIAKLLDEYNDNTEQVTAHLLDHDLPPHLSSLDQADQLPPSSPSSTTHTHLIPRSTPPLLPTRHNIFDDDPLDTLTVSANNLHIGRKNASLTADSILADRSGAPAKAAILSALAAFDSDDDERDDTYDAEDVGGTIDTPAPSAPDEAESDPAHEEALFSAYKATPELFQRDAATRRGKARAALKAETGMTDEAIEGWGIMIGRDSRALGRLEGKYAAFRGGQRDLPPTEWRATPDEEESQGADSGRGQGRGRGPGRGSGRRRGNTRGRGSENGAAGSSSNEHGTQVNRQRKEANKGSRANHNRRHQRAKKMARGGFPG